MDTENEPNILGIMGSMAWIFIIIAVNFASQSVNAGMIDQSVRHLRQFAWPKVKNAWERYVEEYNHNSNSDG